MKIMINLCALSSTIQTVNLQRDSSMITMCTTAEAINSFTRKNKRWKSISANLLTILIVY